MSPRLVCVLADCVSGDQRLGGNVERVAQFSDHRQRQAAAVREDLRGAWLRAKHAREVRLTQPHLLEPELDRVDRVGRTPRKPARYRRRAASMPCAMVTP